MMLDIFAKGDGCIFIIHKKTMITLAKAAALNLISFALCQLLSWGTAKYFVHTSHWKSVSTSWNLWFTCCQGAFYSHRFSFVNFLTVYRAKLKLPQ